MFYKLELDQNKHFYSKQTF